MDIMIFKNSARFIVRRNVSERVDRVLAKFEPKNGRLRLVYCIRGLPTNDDLEDCEIACSEIIAEFPEIREAETQCQPSEQYASETDLDEIFSRV
ncbi:MAG: hypothetical protein LBE78_09905 [Burkholderiaceae bacterium]|nr:hypothetical protein [Burkholderiaceae bacterium]